MSYLYTLENAERDTKQNNLVNIINPIVVWDDTLEYYPYIVKAGEAMKIDLICISIYGSMAYIDELLSMNNIYNPWSIREGDIIYYVDEDSILNLQLSTTQDMDAIVTELVNSSKDTKKDPNRYEGTGLSPTIKPANFKDVEVDYNNKTIKIIDKLQ